MNLPPLRCGKLGLADPRLERYLDAVEYEVRILIQRFFIFMLEFQNDRHVILAYIFPSPHFS